MKFMGSRLTQERKRIGLSQESLAILGGVKANAQGHYESGKRRPRADYLAAISVSGVDVNFVVTGQRIVGFNAETVHAIMSELHNRIWNTAQAIANLSQLLDPTDTRTPQEHLADYVKVLDTNS